MTNKRKLAFKKLNRNMQNLVLTKAFKKLKNRKKRTAPKLTSALKGTTRMPRLTINRVYDSAASVLKTSNQTQPGFWIQNLFTTIEAIPNIVAFLDIYRFVRIKKIRIEYTPSTRSDEYAKLFAYATTITDSAGVSSTRQELYNAHGGALEIKQLKYDGYLVQPTNWEQCLNRAGKLRKCSTVKPFSRTIIPKCHQQVQDMATGVDPSKIISSPWVSTDIANNLKIVHYMGYDCFHTMNNISYDNSKPLEIQHRYAVQLEFKGFKV